MPDDAGNEPAAPTSGDLLQLTRTDGPDALLLVEDDQGESIVGRILDGAIPYGSAADQSLPSIPGGYPDGVVGLKSAGGTTLIYRLAVDATGLAAISGKVLDVDTGNSALADGYWVARDAQNEILAVLGKHTDDEDNVIVTLLHGRATDGMSLTRLGDTSGETWILRSSDRVATLDGKIARMQRHFTYTVEVAGDMAAVDAGQGLRDRLAENGSATLYVAVAQGKPQAVTVTAVNLTLGLIDISGPAALLRAGLRCMTRGRARPSTRMSR